jgi:hypothetical protein
MTRCTPLLVALVIGAAVPAQIAPVNAQAPSLLDIVADGKPWTFSRPDGKGGQVTLMPDGKGRMQMGSMVLSPTWTPTADGFCLKPVPIVPANCLALVRDGKAILGQKNGKTEIRLERP